MTILKNLRAFFIVGILLVSSGLSAAPCRITESQNPDSIWRQLQVGNKKFIANPKFARQRAKLADGQNPPAVVLCCSDSRVPPELVFTQGLGKLFVARVAGNTVDDIVVDSIEFAVNTWDVSIIVVLGHTRCGAVEGALARLRKNNGVVDTENGHLLAVLIPIETAIVAAGVNIYAPDALEQATIANIAYSANQLIAQSPSIAKAVEKGRVEIIGAEYSVKTGKVTELFVIGNSSSSSS